jgi:fructosamine-3-kinase
VTVDARAAAEEITGTAVTEVRPGGSGVYRVGLASGEVVAVKHCRDHDAARAEGESLRWLAEPGAVPVPLVHGFGPEWLVTEWVEPGAPSPRAAEALGRGLAALHASGAPGFGAAPPSGPVDAWIGLAPMRNEPEPSWPEFFVRHRIEPYLRRAVDAGALPATGPVTEVCERIEDLAGPPEPPARLHGDLWSGNVHWAVDGRAWLIDPAAHGGHRETDLANLGLFGCPELDRVLAAYQERAPLADGWRARVPLHRLFLLLVHVVLFGGGYAAQTVSAAKAALRG